MDSNNKSNQTPCNDHLVRFQQLDQSHKRTLSSGSGFEPRYWQPKHLVRVKKLDKNATIPTQSNSSDAGWDMYALEDTVLEPSSRTLVKTGVSLEIPPDFVGLIWPRSGLAVKSGIDVFAGVVDSGYRGDVGVCLYNSSDSTLEIKKGDRIAQILFQPSPFFKLTESDQLTSSNRGQGGFGSTGR